MHQAVQEVLAITLGCKAGKDHNQEVVTQRVSQEVLPKVHVQEDPHSASVSAPKQTKDQSLKEEEHTS